MFQEMCEGLLEESDGEGELGQDAASEVGGAQAAPQPALPATAMEKKTEQQRRREKAARTLVSPGPPASLAPVPSGSKAALVHELERVNTRILVRKGRR